MTIKFDRFKAALAALCREHNVQLTVSGYDAIHVYDRNNDEPIHANGIEDKTADEGTPK